MINLLSTQQKKDLAEKRSFRLFLILEILLLSFFVSFFLVLFLVKNYISLDLETQKISLSERNNIISLNQDLEKEIKEYNTLFFDFKYFYQQTLDVSQLLEKIEETLPSGTYFTDINLTTSGLKGGKRAKVSISGQCQSRQTLLTFKSQLEQEELFFDVYFAPTSWIEPINAEFDVTFLIN